MNLIHSYWIIDLYIYMGEIRLKKVLFILLLLTLFLVGCSSDDIHENVDEILANDARQVTDRILENVENGVLIEDVSEEDHNLFESYTKKYIEDRGTVGSPYSGANKTIETMASASLVEYSQGITLESDVESLKENIELMEKAIVEGRAAGE